MCISSTSISLYIPAYSTLYKQEIIRYKTRVYCVVVTLLRTICQYLFTLSSNGKRKPLIYYYPELLDNSQHFCEKRHDTDSSLGKKSAHPYMSVHSWLNQSARQGIFKHLCEKSYPLHQGLPAGFPSSDRSILMIVTFNGKVDDGGWRDFYDSPGLLQRGKIRGHGERRRMRRWFIAVGRAFTQTTPASRQ